MQLRKMTLLLAAIVFTFAFRVTANADLVGLWRFDSDVSPQPDATGNGQDASLEGDVVWANDSERGGTMEFDGDQDYLLVEDTDLLSVEGDLTIAAWANFAQFDTWNSILAKGGVAHTNFPAPYDVYTHQNGDGRVSMYVGNDDVIAQVNSDFPPEVEVWTHIAITATEDGEIFRYLDGEINGEGFVDAPKGDVDEPLYIGSRGDFVTNMFGRLDDVAIFNEVLDQNQIATIMAGDFSAWGIGGATRLQAGDADEDLKFDQRDLVKVQVAAKYLTGAAATWGDGDWDAAPGGEPGSPPPGDGLFNQLDIIQALNNGLYLTGPYAAVVKNPAGDGNATLTYDAGTGELAVQVGGTELTSINIDSAASIFTGDAAQNLGGSFDNDADNNIFKATFGSSFGSLSFGNVAQAGLSEDFVLNDLTVIGSLAGGGDLGNVDLIYVPEPSSLILLVLAAVSVAGMAQRHRKR
jgi:hypothetical protein